MAKAVAKPATKKDAKSQAVKKELVPKKKHGRPTRYSDEVGKAICARLATGEESLRKICLDDNMPAESTVRDWALNPEHPFSAQYVRAREIGYHAMADEIIDISDDGSRDIKTVMRDGQEIEQLDHDHIQRSRLRVESRKWMVSKMLPKIYGDKTESVSLNNINIDRRVQIAFVDGK